MLTGVEISCSEPHCVFWCERSTSAVGDAEAVPWGVACTPSTWSVAPAGAVPEALALAFPIVAVDVGFAAFDAADAVAGGAALVARAATVGSACGVEDACGAAVAVVE